MLITVIGVLAMWLAHSSAATLGEVHTEYGRVKGKNVRMGSIFGSSSVDVFKGVPFADIPGRWEKPKPHPGWDGVLQATKYRDRCLQVNMMQMGTVGSEDCLYLNIFVPQGRRVSSNLPVMVYLFGGAFLLGASNDAAILGDSLYDGKEMADRGGVIVVTVNYRVGTLGFLSTGDSRLPGNYGLWDQHTAISWVHRNIRNFGGNVDNITIFGQSAGAASVSYQMLSPYNKGLFRRAISQSGTALCPWALQSDPMANTKKVARTLGCKTTDEDNMLLCMKMMDPVGVVMAGKINLMELVMGSGPVMDLLSHVPVVDGDFIPDHPSALFGNAAEFDYMAGVNSMDGHFFAGVDVPSINRKKIPTTMEEIKGLLKVLTKAKGAAAINSTYSVYSADWGSFPTDDAMKKTVADIETDYLFLVPTQTALHLHASHSRGAVTYSYLFDMGTRIPGFPSWVGAEHAEELQYLFGKPFATPMVYFPRHRDLSEYMIAYWTNFAKTGDPSGGNSKVPAPWPAFTTKNPPHLIINSKMSKANSVGNDLRAEYVRYWTTTYNALPTV